MNRTRLGLASLFLTGVAVFVVAQTPPSTPPATPPAAGAAPAPGAPAATPPAAAPASDKQKFETKFEKDKAFYQELKTTVTQTIKVQNASDLVQTHEQTFYFKWLPTNLAADKWTVKQTIEGIKMVIDIAGNQVKYDSTDAGSAASNAGLADFFGKLVGSEFTITFGKGMVVEKVEGREEFLKKLGSVNQQMEKLLQKMLTDEAMKQMTDPSFGLTAATEQAVGGTWESKGSLSLGPIGSYDIVKKYTYKGKDAVKKDLDRVDVTNTLTYKAPTGDAGEGLLFKIKGGELKSSDAKAGDGKPKENIILFNPKTGRVEESIISVRLEGKLNVIVGGAETTIDLLQEQTTTVKSKDTTFVEAKK